MVLSPWSPVTGVPGVSPVWIVYVLYCSWALTANDMSVSGIDPQADCLCGVVVTIVGELLGNSDLMDSKSL